MKARTTTANPDPKQDMTVPLSLRTVHGGHPPAWTSRQVGRGDWRRPVAAPPGRQFVALARATPMAGTLVRLTLIPRSETSDAPAQHCRGLDCSTRAESSPTICFVLFAAVIGWRDELPIV